MLLYSHVGLTLIQCSSYEQRREASRAFGRILWLKVERRDFGEFLKDELPAGIRPLSRSNFAWIYLDPLSLISHLVV